MSRGWLRRALVAALALMLIAASGVLLHWYLGDGRTGVEAPLLVTISQVVVLGFALLMSLGSLVWKMAHSAGIVGRMFKGRQKEGTH